MIAHTLFPWGNRLQKGKKEKKGKWISFFIKAVFFFRLIQICKRRILKVWSEQKREEDFWEKHRGSGKREIATKAMKHDIKQGHGTQRHGYSWNFENGEMESVLVDLVWHAIFFKLP